MPWLVAALLTGLIQVCASLVGRVLVSLGAAVITYTGFSSSLDWLKGQVVQRITAMPPEVVGMLSTMKVGTAISIVFSAMLARLVIGGLTDGSVKRWVTK